MILQVGGCLVPVVPNIFYPTLQKKTTAGNMGCRDLYHQNYIAYVGGTHPKTNMPPENQWLEDVFPIKINSPFFGTC